MLVVFSVVADGVSFLKRSGGQGRQIGTRQIVVDLFGGDARRQ